MHFSLQLISRKTNCRNHCCESDVHPLCPSVLVPLRGLLIDLCKGLGAAAVLEQMCQRVFCTPGTDDSKTLLGKIKKFVIPTVAVPPFLRYTAIASFYRISKGVWSCCYRSGLPMSVWENFAFQGSDKHSVGPCPPGQEVMGSQKSHSGKSAQFLLGHITHNSFIGYNFCMYPVILF